jgi:hypothetical protein
MKKEFPYNQNNSYSIDVRQNNSPSVKRQVVLKTVLCLCCSAAQMGLDCSPTGLCAPCKDKLGSWQEFPGDQSSKFPADGATTPNSKTSVEMRKSKRSYKKSVEMRK